MAFQKLFCSTNTPPSRLWSLSSVVERWDRTMKVFTITTVKATKPPTYTIEDTRGEPVQETFYEQELQTSVQEIYRIERVLKRVKTEWLSSGNVATVHTIRGYH